MSKGELKEKMLDIAYPILEKEGIGNIRIRTLAHLSQCSIGSVYNVFEDFTDIQFHLNARTFKAIFNTLYNELLKSIESGDSLEQLVTRIGWAYIQFGKDHYHCWKSLFELAPDAPQPGWYMQEIVKNLEKFEIHLVEDFALSQEQANRLINYFWFSIHGVSSILLNKKAMNFSDAYIEPYVDHCLKGIFINYENKQEAECLF